MSRTEHPEVGSKTDWQAASPDELKHEIALTRAHMDARLSDLGRKLRLDIDFKRLKYPAAALAAIAAGLAIYLIARPKPRMKKAKAKITRLKVKSAGMWDYVRALRMLATVVRKGKPAIFIVDPGKS